MGEPSLAQLRGGVKWGGTQEVRVSTSELGSRPHMCNGMEMTGDT